MNQESGPSQKFIQDNREAIGRQIREYREKKGFSQDELAQLMQIHRSTISKVESGKFAITVDYFLKFGWYLGFQILISKR